MGNSDDVKLLLKNIGFEYDLTLDFYIYKDFSCLISSNISLYNYIKNESVFSTYNFDYAYYRINKLFIIETRKEKIRKLLL